MKLRGKAGFTLVEVMISLMIMSLMLVAITEVLSGARQARDVIHNARESQLAGPAILDLIEADLRGLFVGNRAARHILRVQDDAISGMDADRIDFVTSSNNRMLTPNSDRTRFLRADVTEVGYCLKNNRENEGDFLEIWRREGFGVDAEPFSGGKFTFLHDRVRRFDIQVFQEDGSDAEPLESWGLSDQDDEFLGLPARIEIELELEPGSRLLNEQTARSRRQKRRVIYRRIIHFPASMHLALSVRPVPRIPLIEPPVLEGGRQTGPGPSGGPPAIPPGGSPPPIVPGGGTPPIFPGIPGSGGTSGEIPFFPGGG